MDPKLFLHSYGVPSRLLVKRFLPKITFALVPHALTISSFTRFAYYYPFIIRIFFWQTSRYFFSDIQHHWFHTCFIINNQLAY